MQRLFFGFVMFLLAVGNPCFAEVKENFPADHGAPGDRMIQAYLTREADKIDSRFEEDLASRESWEKLRPGWLQEYYYMLGLWPLPEKTPLAATVTGTLRGDGYVVEMLHYQSRPQLYVTGNLYRPAVVQSGQRLPAVFYVCGHSNQGRCGNKTAYQSHGIWFARHGYVCLMVDTLQLGEIAGVHHGSYREGRWWWHSRGYVPSGVEAWNGVRGIDYLAGRGDVDPGRIAVTGISGGGAATFWIAAADPRVRVAVPVSGMADLRSYVGNRVINGHCDCMFLYNTFQWPWTRIAALVAPRPLLFANSDQDGIFPMDANERVINRLKRVYSLYGVSDLVDAFVSIGKHAYRQDLRQGAYRFINMHLKDDPRIVLDSEADLVTGEPRDRHYPIAPDRLRVFPADSDIPKDELNTMIDRHFVAMAKPALPQAGGFDAWRKALCEELRRVTFRYFPERIPPARKVESAPVDGERLQTEPGIEAGLQQVTAWVDLRTVEKSAKKITRILLVVQNPDSQPSVPEWLTQSGAADDAMFLSLLAPRGVDRTRWTRKNPPNYVERAHVLLGRTVDTGRVWDIVATARYLRAEHGGEVPVYVAGESAAGVLAAYAALWEPEIAGVIVKNPPRSHMEADAPQLLNVLRVCDIPDVFGMLAPRPLCLYAEASPEWDRTAAIYRAAGAADKFVRK